MKKHEVIMDMTNNFLTFWPSHYTNIRASFLNRLDKPRLSLKTAVIMIEKDITPQKTIKKG